MIPNTPWLPPSSGAVVKPAANSDSVVTAIAQPEAPKRSYVDQITDLITERPGIVNAEIADALDIWAADVRPLLQPRIENSRIIVDKIPGANGLINAYRINPKWRPSDAEFKPIKTEQDEPLRRKPGPVAKPRAMKKEKGTPSAAKPAAAVPNPLTAPARAKPAANATPDAAWPLPAAVDPRAAEFACAVYSDGTLRIELGTDVVLLDAGRAGILAKHLALYIGRQEHAAGAIAPADGTVANARCRCSGSLQVNSIDAGDAGGAGGAGNAGAT